MLFRDRRATLRRAFLCLGSGAAHLQRGDLIRLEAQLAKNRLVVLAKRWATPCRHLRHAMHLYWTADRPGQLAAGPFERDHDVIRLQLRILDHLLRAAHDAECDVSAIEHLV